MKELWRKWDNISLIKRIVVGLIIGAILGVTCGTVPGLSDVLTLLGTLFTSALKAIAPILVFFLVISALASAKTGGAMSTIVVLYIISTFLAALVAVIASFIFPIEMTLVVDPSVEQSSPEGIGEVLSSLVASIVANPVDALVNANYLGILAWAVMLGVALRAAKEATKDVFHNVADAVGQVVHWIISLAPFGIMGLVFTAVSTNGVEIFTEYGQLLLVLVGCMLFIAFVVNPALVWVNIRKNPYPLVWRCIKESGLTAFFTRSSAANIPVNMTLCRKLGLDEDNYSVSIPLGATINMAGASVTISVMTMTACPHPGHRGGHPDRRHPFGAGRRLRMRCLRRCGRFAAAHPAGMLAVRHQQRRGHAGRRRRLHHRRHPGLLRDRAQLVLRRAAHRDGRIPFPSPGRPGSQLRRLGEVSRPRNLRALKRLLVRGAFLVFGAIGAHVTPDAPIAPAAPVVPVTPVRLLRPARLLCPAHPSHPPRPAHAASYHSRPARRQSVRTYTRKASFSTSSRTASSAMCSSPAHAGRSSAHGRFGPKLAPTGKQRA